MTQIELKNSNGIGSEVILANLDSNVGGGKTLDVSKLVEETSITTTFTTTDGKTITVTNGIITGVA